MLESGFLAGLVAKLAALGTAAKVGVATTTAALTVTAAAAGGVLAVRAGDSGPIAGQGEVAQSSVAETAVVAEPTTPTTSAQSDAQGGGDALVTTQPGSTSGTARADAAVDSPATPTASLTPSLPASVPGLPDLSGLTQIPGQVLACLDPVFDMVSSLPAVSPQQIGGIGPSIVGCVTGIVRNLPLPFGLNACISEIMGFVSDMTSQVPSGIPDVGGLDVAACIPSGLPVPTGSSGGFPFMGGGFPFGR